MPFSFLGSVAFHRYIITLTISRLLLHHFPLLLYLLPSPLCFSSHHTLYFFTPLSPPLLPLLLLHLHPHLPFQPPLHPLQPQLPLYLPLQNLLHLPILPLPPLLHNHIPVHPFPRRI